MDVTIVRKNIKNLNLRIIPPHGTVHVSAPHGYPEEHIRQFIRLKSDWIVKHQERIRNTPWAAPLHYETGEMHHFLGKEYRLEVYRQNRTPAVTINDDTIVLNVRTGSNRHRRRMLLEEWYRSQLKSIVPEIIHRYEPLMNLSVSDWRIKKMKTKWGTCNISEKRIWINLELARKPVNEITEVVVHEMVHLLERKHTKRFYELLEYYLKKGNEV